MSDGTGKPFDLANDEIRMTNDEPIPKGSNAQVEPSVIRALIRHSSFVIRASRRRSGLVLVELMVVIGLVAFMAVAMTRVLTWTLRVTEETERRHTELSVLDGMMRELRADAWGAVRLEAESRRRAADGPSAGLGGEVRMIGPDGREVRWRAGEGVVERAVENEVRVWELASPVSLDVEGAAVVVRVGREDVVEVRAVSELILLGGGGE